VTIILIDGPSGSGKTSLALRMTRGWTGPDAPQLIQLDDIYPGWDGLEAASVHLTEQVLRPLRDGRPARWQRFDWSLDEPAEWHEVDPQLPLVVEGCGALSRANSALADIRIFVETDDLERKRRALARDGELYSREWDRWDEQWQRFAARELPRDLATIIVPT
jgi:uridine kinase